MIKYLIARNQLYILPNLLVVIGFSVAIFLSVSSLAQVWWPEKFLQYATYIAAVSVIYAIFDSYLLDPFVESRTFGCAEVIDQFDRKLFDMDGNEHTRGLVSRATIDDMAHRGSKMPLSQFKNWYREELGDLPRDAAVLVAQYTSMAYNKALRESYLRMLRYAQFVILALVVLIFILGNLDAQTFVLSVMVPFLPILTWVLKMLSKTKLMVSDQDRALKIIDSQWQLVCDRKLSGANLKDAANDNQADLFRRRAMSTLLFPSLYRILRPKLEGYAHRDAKRFVEEYNSGCG